MEYAEDDLRADFQQYYTLNLDDMGDGYSVSHASVCAAKLPSYSRSWLAYNNKHPIENRKVKPKQGKQGKYLSLPIDELKAKLNQTWEEA